MDVKHLAALGLLAASAAHAANWMQVDESTSADVFVDTASVRPDGRYLRAWVMYKLNGKDKTKAWPEVEYQNMKSLYIYDCAAERSAVVQQVFYGDREALGNVVHSTSRPIAQAESALDAPIPESVGESVLRRVCTLKPRKRAP